RGLALAVDHLGVAHAQRAMVVHRGHAVDLRERQRAQLIHCRRGSGLPRADALEQAADLVRVHYLGFPTRMRTSSTAPSDAPRMVTVTLPMRRVSPSRGMRFRRSRSSPAMVS